MIAVTRDKVIVFSVGVEGETCGDDLVKITGAGGNGFVVKSSKYVCVGQLEPETGLGLVSNLVYVGGACWGVWPPIALVNQGRGDKLELVHTVQCDRHVYLLSPCPSGTCCCPAC